jgi:hypothetical protein
MPYAYAYAGFRHLNRYHFVPVLHSQIFFGGAIGNFFCVQTLLNCTNSWNASSKNFHIFFSYEFLGVRQAEF